LLTRARRCVRHCRLPYQ